MLNLKLKKSHLIFLLLLKNVNIVEDYDKCVLYLIFIKCYHHLCSMSKF